MRTRLIKSVLPTVLLIGFVIAPLHTLAQTSCQAQWSQGRGVPGFDQPVYHLTQWDPDGAGPLPPVVVASGGFTIAGDSLADGLAMIDVNARTLAPFPSITGRSYSTSITLPNGDLIVSGFFGTPQNGAYRIARWNGTAWTFFGGLLISPPSSLAVSPAGDLYASSLGSLPRGLPFIGLARWDGSAWQELPNSSQLSGPLLFLPDGDLVAAGAYSVARWDGASWQTLGTGQGFDGSGVYAMARAGNGDIIAVGHFNTADGVPARAAARWNGTAWGPISPGLTPGEYAECAVTAPNGDVIAAFTHEANSYDGGWLTTSVRRWNGVAWYSVSPTLNGIVDCLTALPNGDTLAGGNFVVPGTPFARNVALARAGQWQQWTGFGDGMCFPIHAQAVLANGDLVAAGAGTDWYEVRPPGRLMRSSAGQWTAFAPDPDRQVNALAVTPNGDLVVGGVFENAGSIPALYIARWNGATWSPVGAGLGAPANAVLVLPNGDIIAGGLFTYALAQPAVPANHIVRWDGTQWLPLGQGLDDQVNTLLRLPNGDLVAGGNFSNAGGIPASRIALWNGSAWTPLSDGLDGSVLALALLPDGSLIAGGQFSHSGANYVSSVARWDGNSWAPLGSADTTPVAPVRALRVLPNGDLLAAGDPGYEQTATIARWDGAHWSPLSTSTNGAVDSIEVLPSGDISIGGEFTSTNAGISAYIARLMVPSADFDRDGSPGTDADIEAFFACLAGNCCSTCGSTDFNGDGDYATDADIEAFFRVLAGGSC